MRKWISVVAAVLVAALLTGAAPVTGRVPGGNGGGDSALMPGENVADRAPDGVGEGAAAPGGNASSDEDAATVPDGDVAPAPGEEDTPAPDTEEALRAAELLNALGIMSGVGKNPDGSINYALDKVITRQETVTLIARAAGYACSKADPDFPHPFTDVSGFAQASVGYAYRKGITNGTSASTFNASAQVTGRELVSFMLRALGYGEDFDWREACAFADSIGLTDGELGRGLERITRGDAAKVVLKLLVTPPKGLRKNYLTRLVETGALSRDTVTAAGLWSSLYPYSSDTVTAQEAAERYKDSLITVTAKDIFLKGSSFHGTVLAPGVAAAPLDAVKGCMYMTLTDSTGAELEFTGILGHDQQRGLVYIGFKSREIPWGEEGESAVFPVPLYESLAPAEGEEEGSNPSNAAPDADELLYAVSDLAVAFARGETMCARAAAIVTDSRGELIGIQTDTGIWTPEVQLGAGAGLYEYTRDNWPELLPPVYPRGIDPDKPMTAITYDDGPHATYTPQLLDLLEQYGAVATFFEVGSRVQKWPQFIPRMEALHCEVANHSWDHSTLTKLSRDGVISQIQRTDAAIEAVTGHKVNLVRCPGGSSNATVAGAVGHPIIYWTIDTRDWESRNAAKVIAHVKNDLKDLNGAIILMHSSYATTVEASRTIIPYILDGGYQTVTVTEMAFFRGVELENGKTYVKFPAK